MCSYPVKNLLCDIQLVRMSLIKLVVVVQLSTSSDDWFLSRSEIVGICSFFPLFLNTFEKSELTLFETEISGTGSTLLFRMDYEVCKKPAGIH